MSQPTAMPPPTDAPAVTPRAKSKGEKFFDRAVYGGVAGVGTFIVTLPIAFKLKHGTWGDGNYGRIVDWTEKQAVRLFNPTLSRKIAEEGVMTTSLMMGGNAMLLPVGVAEHYKTPIVNGLNVALGDKTPPDAIEQAPKQTWSSLIEGRALAWLVVFTSIMAATSKWGIPKTFATFTNEFAERSHALTQWLSRSKAPVTHMAESKSYRYGKLAALDVFATAAAATLLYVGGHFFARRHEEKQERRASIAQTGDGVNASAGTELSTALPATEPLASSAPQAHIHGEKYAQGTLHAAAAPSLQHN